MGSSFSHQFTLPKLDGEILEYHRSLEKSSRSDPNRPTLLYELAGLRIKRREFSNEKGDLDKAITHLTEAVLLETTEDVVFMLFQLAGLLRSRYSFYQQPDDVKSSIRYFRFLRINFHSLEAFDVPHTSGDLSSNLFHALAHNLVLTPRYMVQDLEEMVALIPEFITADILTYDRKNALEAFSEAVAETDIFRREDTQQVANQAIHVLREAAVLNPDFDLSYALSKCLAIRFKTRLEINDYEEAIAIADRIVAPSHAGNGITTQRDAMMLISVLLLSRLDLSPSPEYLEVAIHRIRSFVPCLPDDDRTMLADVLDALTQRRFKYFGATENSGGTPPNSHFETHIRLNFGVRSNLGASQESEARSQMQETLCQLRDVAIAIEKGEITNVEAAVERSRKLLPLQKSSDKWSLSSDLAEMFTYIIFSAYQCTKRPAYLDEAIRLPRIVIFTRGQRCPLRS